MTMAPMVKLYGVITTETRRLSLISPCFQLVTALIHNFGFWRSRTEHQAPEGGGGRRPSMIYIESVDGFLGCCWMDSSAHPTIIYWRRESLSH